MDALTTVSPPTRIESRLRPAGPIVAGILAAAKLFLAALERSRQRRAMAAMDDRLLQDIGLTREDFVRRTSCYQPRL